MAKSYADKLKDPRWQKKRLGILERDEFTCMHCGATDKTLHVHHTFYGTGKEPWEAKDNCLKTLCFSCHEDEPENYNSKMYDLRRMLMMAGKTSHDLDPIIYNIRETFGL